MTKTRVPSAAQAKRIAGIWSNPDGHKVSVMVGAPDGKPAYSEPTIAALVKYGWLISTGETKHYANGYTGMLHVLSPAALGALEDFIRKQRFDRAFPKAA